MKIFYFTMALFAAVIAVTIIHISLVSSFQENGVAILQRVDNAVQSQNFDSALDEINNFDKLFQSRRRWFSLILDTADVDKIEVHISRMKKFIELRAIPQFYNDFIELYESVKSLPYREGIHFEVLF